MSIQTHSCTKFDQSLNDRCIDFAIHMMAALVIGLWLSANAFATPEKAASYYEDALRRFEKEDTAGSIIQLKNAIQQDQKMLAAHLLLGKALLKNGDLKGAEAAFEEALKQGVNRGEIALPLGQVYLALGRPEAVIDRIHPSGLSPALQVEVLTMRGNAYMEAGNVSQAKQSWDQARSIDPRSALPLIAEVPMLLAAKRIDQAREQAEKAVELAPGNSLSWNAKASVHHAVFDAKSALAAYDKAIYITPKHIDSRVARAALLIDLKRDGDARKDLDFLRTISEDDPRAAYLRAVLAQKQGDQVATSEALKEVTRTIDALPPAWLARREQLLMAGALAHCDLGNQQKSREYLDSLLSRNPTNLGAKKLLASIYVESKDYGRAQPILDSLQRALPEDPQVMFMLGSINLAQRRYAQASSLLEQAAKTGSPQMTRSLAFSQLGAGQTEKGLGNLEKAFSANPADTQAGIALSMVYMRKGKTEKAMKVADVMVKRDSTNLTALNLLASLKVAAGDNTGARAVYGQVLAKDPSFIPAILNLARLDAGDKHYDEARRRLNVLLKANSNDPQVLFEFGKLEQRAGMNADAVRYLTKASEVQRSDPTPGLALIELHLSQRKPDLALAAAKDLSGKYSSNLQIQIALARTYLANGDANNAKTILSAATRLAEYDPRAQVSIARLQLAAGNPEGASYSVYKALQGSPDDVAALALAVQVESVRGDAAKADTALKNLMAKHPESIEAVITAANLAMSRNQFQSAISSYQKVLTRQSSAENVLALGRAYLAAGEPAKATTLLEGWISKHPSDKLVQKVLAEVRHRSGQFAAAKQTYRKVIAMDPDDAASLNNFASLLYQMREVEAQAIAERAVKLAPEHPAYADTLGWILVTKGQIDQGLRYLREARLRDPESVDIRFHLSYALAKAGRKQEAREELMVVVSSFGRPNAVELELLRQLKLELGI